MRLYSVPDDFDVWDAPPGNGYVESAGILPGGEPGRRRAENTNFNFNTKKILMLESGSSFKFALSEVEFFASTCTYVA